MKRAVFLDRDGVINRKPAETEYVTHYVTRWEDFQFLPGAAEAIASLNREGWRVIVISNQRCVAKGLLTIDELEGIHRKMNHELGRLGAKLDGIYYCPHDKDPPCACRKPSPGMLLTAVKEHQIDLRSSWMIGDSESDMLAGKRAGCRTIRITPELPAENENADGFARSLLEATARVLRLTERIP
jgi:histidinol-phosphate phosphatase family protein